MILDLVNGGAREALCEQKYDLASVLLVRKCPVVLLVPRRIWQGGKL